MSVPESFLCPISQQVMVDPYIDTDGNSYERSAIMEWLATRQVSPITRRPLKPGDLVPNRVLKTLIEEYKNSSGTFNTARGAEEEAAAPLDRKPLMLLAVIDNSGSMGESCGNNPTGEDDGFSRLDLVKHTMNTIITALAPQDKICLIKFSNSAEVIANLTSLTPTSKKFLMQTMQDLVPEYSTNIWDGLRAALDIVASLPASTVEEYNIQVFLLTDGVPNMNPPRPITETLETYLKKKCAGRRPQVHTFGYGYSLQSDVLYELAKVANGCFGFIPDSSMVGTVFINSLSSTLVGADPSMSNATIDAVADKFCTLLRALLAEPVCQDFVQQDNQLRAFVADVEGQLAEARADGSDARAIDFLESLLLDCKGSSDPNLGQVAKAVQPQFCRKWGKHYLYSVLSAFEHRVCINFKDKAMQIFKSERFKIEQERVEEVFLTLPAPKPHASNNQQYGSQYASRAAAAPASMANYHTAHGGCFTGDSVVLAVREERVVPVLVRDLRPEDTVLSQLGATQVECIVKLRYNGPVFQGKESLCYSASCSFFSSVMFSIFLAV